MNLKVIQVKYFLTWCIINLANSSDTIKTKCLAGLKMDNKWQKLHKDRNVYRVFGRLLKTICCLGLQRNVPCGKARHSSWTCTFFTAVGRLKAQQWSGRPAFNMVTLIFQSRGNTSTDPKLQPENIPKASELLL